MNSGRDVARSVAGGFSWNVTGSAVRALLSFFVNIVLARVLGPAPFGQIALAMVLVGLAGTICDWGLGSALVQRPATQPHDIAYVFGFRLTVGTALALALTATAPLFARLFNEPALCSLVPALSCMLVIQALGTVSGALLTRRMNFRRLQEAQLASYLVGFAGVGLPLALGRFGVWSLVAAQIIQALASTLIIFLSAPYPLAVTLRDPGGLLRFGSRVVGTSMAAWVTPNLANAIIGWRFGATDLGYYGRAANLSLTPVGIVVTSAQSVLFPAISRLGAGSRASRLFASFLGGLSALLIPAYALAALGSREIIVLLYGSAWLPAAPLLTPLAFAMLLSSLAELSTPILTGLGLPQKQMGVEWAVAGVALAALLVASRVSLIATAWAVLIVYALRLVLLATRTTKALGMAWWPYVRALLSGAVLAAAASAGWSLAAAFLPSGMALISRVLAQAAIAVTCWAAAFFAGRRILFPDLHEARSYFTGLRKPDPTLRH